MHGICIRRFFGRPARFPLWFSALSLVVACLCGTAHAQTPLRIRPPGFAVSDEIQGRIDFWKLVFTKYGEDHLVFHHREHPQIIYSVLDLGEYKTTFGGKELARATNQAVEQEIDRIQKTLNRLADGEAPANAAERRLAHLFSLLPGSLSANYRAAADVEAIRYQKGVRELFMDGLVRSGRYLHAMERVFAQEGLPVELTRLPLVESSFNYTAYSAVGAAGIWQFMRATGYRFMRIDSSIDERKDPIMSTRAAARYFTEAYGRLGEWPLAVTSYNHGVSGVARAVSELGTKDLGTIIRKYDGTAFGFASKNFYAEFMAALEVEQRSAAYFPGLQREAPWKFDEVRLGRPMSYSELVRFSKADATDIENLNRALLGPVVNGRVKIPAGMIVRVPQGKGQLLLASIGNGEIINTEAGVESVLGKPKKGKPEPVVTAKTSGKQKETGKSGKSKVTGKQKDVGKQKDIGKKEKAESAAGTVQSHGETGRKKYIVQKGDNPSKIAKKLGISQARLKALNPKVGTKLKPGQELIAGE